MLVLMTFGAVPSHASIEECLILTKSNERSEESVVDCVLAHAQPQEQCLPANLVCAEATAYAGVHTSCPLRGGGYGTCVRGGGFGEASSTAPGIQGILTGAAGGIALADSCDGTYVCDVADDSGYVAGTSIVVDVTVQAISSSLGLTISANDHASA